MTKNTKTSEKFIDNFVIGIDKSLDKAIEEEKQELKPERKHKLPVILEPEEAQKLLKQPNRRYPTGLRNKAMMALISLRTPPFGGDKPETWKH